MGIRQTEVRFSALTPLTLMTAVVAVEEGERKKTFFQGRTCRSSHRLFMLLVSSTLLQQGSCIGYTDSFLYGDILK
jgi:hypothetical protein